VVYPPYLTCFYEKVGWQLFGLEGTAGVEFSLDPYRDGVISLAPYTVLGYYADDYAWWIEARIPDDFIPTIGSSDFVRAGVTYRW
jgi:hypothetical protein